MGAGEEKQSEIWGGPAGGVSGGGRSLSLTKKVGHSLLSHKKVGHLLNSQNIKIHICQFSKLSIAITIIIAMVS